jgi:hypothetical protein
MDERIEKELTEIKAMLAQLLSQRPVQAWYDTASAAKELEKSRYTVREYCRERRCIAEKRKCGRGKSKEWMISHEELQRLKSEGLLPRKPPQ